MNTISIELLRRLREDRDITQEQMADKLAISRQSYLSIEQGKRGLTFEEAVMVAEMLGVSVNQLANGLIPNDEKYRQMIFAFIKDASGNDGKIPKTKLAKLLYLADFGWFYEHLQSMSGMSYRKIQYGPVPDPFFRIVEEAFESGDLNIAPTKAGAMLISVSDAGSRMGTDMLSNDEKKLIKQIAQKWKKKRTSEIVAFTHKQLPYSICADGEIIPYELITQEDPEYVC